MKHLQLVPIYMMSLIHFNPSDALGKDIMQNNNHISSSLMSSVSLQENIAPTTQNPIQEETQVRVDNLQNINNILPLSDLANLIKKGQDKANYASNKVNQFSDSANRFLENLTIQANKATEDITSKTDSVLAYTSTISNLITQDRIKPGIVSVAKLKLESETKTRANSMVLPLKLNLFKLSYACLPLFLPLLKVCTSCFALPVEEYESYLHNGSNGQNYSKFKLLMSKLYAYAVYGSEDLNETFSSKQIVNISNTIASNASRIEAINRILQLLGEEEMSKCFDTMSAYAKHLIQQSDYTHTEQIEAFNELVEQFLQATDVNQVYELANAIKSYKFSLVNASNI